jgi:hypothetical protein
MPSSNTPLLNLSLLIDVTFSTPTPVYNSYDALAMKALVSLLEAAWMRTVLIASLLLAASVCHAQWKKSEYRDLLHNKTGVKFNLPAKEEGGGIAITCSNGKLEDAWLIADRITDARNGGRWNNAVVDVEYRRDDEPKPHKITLPVNSNFQGVLLQSPDRVGLDPKSVFGFEQLLYGPIGFGGGEWKKNKKANNWAHRVIVGVSVFASADVVYTFDVPDPSPVREACGIK